MCYTTEVAHFCFAVYMSDLFAIYGQIFGALDSVMTVVYYTWIFVLPPVLYKTFFALWMDYIQDIFATNTPYDTIEIIPPKNVERSPQPMESLFAGLQGSRITIPTYGEFCEGAMQPAISFEIVGTDHGVRFYVLLPSELRDVFESHLYAQYPDVHIRDVEDYVQNIPALIPNKDWDIWGADLELLKPDPVPIRTWQHFEEDVTGKMIDPLSGMLEVMSRARAGEYLVWQIIIEPLPEGWKDEGAQYVEELKGKKAPPKIGAVGKLMLAVTGFLGSGSSGGGGDADDAPLEFRLSPVERKVLEAVEENIGRYMYRVKMRMVYAARRAVFNKAMVFGFFGAMKQFADFNLNAFKPHVPSITYALYLFREARLRFKKRKLMYTFSKRKMSGARFVLSDRELATVYHMPDMSVTTSAINRVDHSTKATAPHNLPTIRPEDIDAILKSS